MKISRIMAAAASAVLAAGMVTTTAFAGRDSIPAEELAVYFKDGNHTLGITGNFSDWGSRPDIPMTDPDGDGIFCGVICGLSAGRYEFKVRSDGNWDDNWGAYDDVQDKTFNSQINCVVEVDDRADIYVTLDTNGDDCVVWPVNFCSTEEMQPSKYGITGNMLNWGVEPDAPMYEIMPGKFVGVLPEVAAGEQQFKVRANSSWDESYGVYEPDYDRTNNSQTNCSTTIPDSGVIVVELDTTGEDNILWPVSFTAIDSANNAFDIRYTGKEKEEPSSPEESDPSQESSQEQESSETGESMTESSEEESVIEISAESGEEISDGQSTTSAEAGVSDTSKSGASNTTSTTTAAATGTTAASSASSASEAPSTGEAVMAILFLSIITAALGVIVLSVKKSSENK